MRICIFGMGAIGGHYAAKLAHAGHEVSVVARGANLAHVREKPIVLRSGAQRFEGRVKGAEDTRELGPQDLVISTLKANALPALARSIESLLGSDTVVVFAQNGIPWWYDMGLPAALPEPPDLSPLDPGGALRAAVPKTRIIGAVINSPNEVLEPGLVQHTNPARNALILGEVDDRQSDRLTAIRTLLEAAQIESPAVPELRLELWTKLMMNMTGSMLALLSGHQVSVVRKEPGIGQLFLRLASEATAIARAHGFDVSAGFNPEGYIPNAPDHTPSIRQDYDLGRPMELESMLLTPLRFGRAAGLETPCLDAIAALAVLMAKDKGLFQGS
ncbi:MAG: 2-dehydropantoate 2-reductase [Gammaproteobacteria bacterium]|nr:2-dehydropantoate 2-reductase [Gammaproteobacteria bacterium]